jgi:hypothetical protein
MLFLAYCFLETLSMGLSQPMMQITRLQSRLEHLLRLYGSFGVTLRMKVAMDVRGWALKKEDFHTR